MQARRLPRSHRVRTATHNPANTVLRRMQRHRESFASYASRWVHACLPSTTWREAMAQGRSRHPGTIWHGGFALVHAAARAHTDSLHKLGRQTRAGMKARTEGSSWHASGANGAFLAQCTRVGIPSCAQRIHHSERSRLAVGLLFFTFAGDPPFDLVVVLVQPDVDVLRGQVSARSQTVASP